MGWVYDDPRLDLMHCDDGVLLNFLCATVHPFSRTDASEVTELIETFNRHLSADGFEVAIGSIISGKSIYVGRRALVEAQTGLQAAREVADALSSHVIQSQVARMESSLRDDPALAIGSAKEFVETTCKAILQDSGHTLTGREDLPRLVHLTRERLRLVASKESAETVRRTISSLAQIVQGIAELRGQIGTGHGPAPDASRARPEVARLAVGMASTLGLFLWETYRDQKAG